MVDHDLLPKFILARVLGRFRQQIGSGLDTKRNVPYMRAKTRARVNPVRATR